MCFFNLCSALNNKVQSVDIANIDFSDHYNIFSDCAMKELDRVAPVITRSLAGTSQPPWMDAEYRQERVIRRTLERNWKASGTTEDKEPYITQRKKCAQLATSKRAEYFSNIISKCEGDTHALFNIVTTVLDKRKTSGILPQFENPKDLANKFNNFYSDKVLHIRNNIKPSKLECDFRKNFNGVLMESLRPTTVDELRLIIKDMGIKTSCQDPMPSAIFKDIIEDLVW